MDGVIEDTEPLHQRDYIHMFDKVGIRISKEQYNRLTGQSTLALCKQLCSHYNLEQHSDELVKIKRKILQNFFLKTILWILSMGFKRLQRNTTNTDWRLFQPLQLQYLR